MTEKELKLLLKTHYADDSLFWVRCLFDYNDKLLEVFYPICASSQSLTELSDKLIESKDENITSTQAYAVLSKQTEKHWYRLRHMLGDKCQKAWTDVGGLTLSSGDFSIVIPSGAGDGTVRYALENRDEWNNGMASFFSSVKGEFLIDEAGLKLSGFFGIYIYSGIIVFERWD